MAKISVKTWVGSGTATVIDMANAGKRGKKCRKLYFGGWRPYTSDRESLAGRAADLSMRVLTYLAETVTEDDDFDAVRDKVLEMVAAAGDLNNAVRVHDREEIRGIDAPRPVLSAGIDGVWSGKADNDGIFLRDLSDANNCPAECTPSGQTNAKAYAVAAKVWDAVRAAKSMHEAGQILRAAGAKLHYWCMMD